MSDVIVFDKSQLMTMACEDEELAGQIAGIFLNDTPKQLASLQEALQNKETKVAERIAHSIKGSSATVGGMELREAAFNCEQLRRDGKLEEVGALYPDLLNRFEKLKTVLNDNGFVAMEVDI